MQDWRNVRGIVGEEEGRYKGQKETRNQKWKKTKEENEK